MPATDFGWSLNEKPPIFQVYGTKRKCASAPTEETLLVKDCPKRRCLETDMTSESVAMETQPISDYYISQQIPSDPCPQSLCSPLQFPVKTVSTPTAAVQNKNHLPTFSTDSAEVENNNHLPCHQSPVFHTQSLHSLSHRNDQFDMERGPHHEVATSERLSTHDLSDAAAGMEEDSPELQQSRLAYCDRFCSGGDVSPTSQRVRCFCVPSWEGLVTGRTYFSDYY